MSDPTTFIHTSMPLTGHLGVVAESLDPACVVLAIDWDPRLCTSGGALHGGAVMALADSAGGACAYLNLPDGAGGTSTIQSATNFVGGVTAGRVTATSRPVHVGGSTIVVETELRNGDRLVAKTVQTQAVLRPRS